MTIFAMSSGRGRAGISVLRVSGDQAGAAIEALTGRNAPDPRQAVLRTFHDTEGGVIDRGIVIWMPGPASFSGEDMAEFHVHGGPAVMAAITGALGDVPGLRPAEPGEFTRRAFENGKLDLTEAEGIGDLIAAETEAQRRQAVRQMSGALGAVYEGWRAELLRALAYMEADLDFADEDLPEDLFTRVRPVVDQLMSDIDQHLRDGTRGERLRSGYQVVILGAPNVGKSSLINALSHRDVAIVSDIAGTTRDTIEVHLDLGGFPVTLVDTAGLREGGGEIEREGVRRALARAQDADATIRLLDATTDDIPKDRESKDLVAFNKMDLVPEKKLPGGTIGLSVKTGLGLDKLLERLEHRVIEDMAPGEEPSLTRLRHRQALEQTLDYLKRAMAAADGGALPELVAEDMRLATRALGRITGRVDVEDLLDIVFADFCIGK